jgi:hypothetical protein
MLAYSFINLGKIYHDKTKINFILKFREHCTKQTMYHLQYSNVDLRFLVERELAVMVSYSSQH